MKIYVSPTGSVIIGTAEMVLATALISGIQDDGTPIYAGGSDVDWDSQITLLRNGKILFIDDDGEYWTFDELKVDGAEEDEDDGE